jgi:hypothetical protein
VLSQVQEELELLIAGGARGHGVLSEGGLQTSTLRSVANDDKCSQQEKCPTGALDYRPVPKLFSYGDQGCSR